ncbi:aspartate ammonia-lyase, partial [Vibrio parahaemolyticus]|uniref:lyase family protein n=1 Tax=Vibrio parahaemolyticus TaxID=670 RepID=UPI00062B1C51
CMDQFPSDVFQGGAGTFVNMNTNVVIANVALELMGKEKGQNEIINPNDHDNKSQSTNCAYPTGFRIADYNSVHKLMEAIAYLKGAFDLKAFEFKDVLKMGRTQHQDAVPMTVGQEFHAWAVTLTEAIRALDY